MGCLMLNRSVIGVRMTAIVLKNEEKEGGVVSSYRTDINTQRPGIKFTEPVQIYFGHMYSGFKKHLLSDKLQLV